MLLSAPRCTTPCIAGGTGAQAQIHFCVYLTPAAHHTMRCGGGGSGGAQPMFTRVCTPSPCSLVSSKPSRHAGEKRFGGLPGSPPGWQILPAAQHHVGNFCQGQLLPREAPRVGNFCQLLITVAAHSKPASLRSASRVLGLGLLSGWVSVCAYLLSGWGRSEGGVHVPAAVASCRSFPPAVFANA